MMQHNPPHPGSVLKELWLDPLRLSASDVAVRLSMSRSTISRVLNGQAAMSSNLAVRLEAAGLGKAYIWIGMQGKYDLWQASHRKQPKITPFKEVEDAKVAA